MGGRVRPSPAETRLQPPHALALRTLLSSLRSRASLRVERFRSIDRQGCFPRTLTTRRKPKPRARCCGRYPGGQYPGGQRGPSRGKPARPRRGRGEGGPRGRGEGGPDWQDFVRDMPWLALPYKEKHRKLKLWNKYRISNIPSLIFLDATTGKVVCRNGLLVIRDDPEGLEFPWGPKPFREVIAGPLLRNNGQSLESSNLEGSHVGVYFSAHWCPPCRSLTRVLVESYRKIKEAGQKFEIIFVSADRSEESFKQYFSEMPWLAVPYTDEARRSRLNRLYGIQGIPTLIVLDPQGEVITRQGRVEVLNDEDCREFPWHPKPVLELSDSNAVQLNEGPCLVLFVDSEDDGESEAAKQLIQPIAEKIIAKYKAKEEEAPLLFFVAGEDDMTDSLRDYTNLPEAAPLLTILDMSARAKYVMDVEEITPAIVEAFVNDFLAEKLKPEPI
ncbi:nucleoredoxin [Trichechus manatus latirostris]|uniref:Nucleoredoxin n=1 Tax=Trichechus manatus latirostris TaxID=127582 RepID=A0A2Y9DKG5_TRIMA|nr:nucleoredoxin [Trichechus manatus latirostris]